MPALTFPTQTIHFHRFLLQTIIRLMPQHITLITSNHLYPRAHLIKKLWIQRHQHFRMRILTFRSFRAEPIHIVLTNLFPYMSKRALISHSTIPFFKIYTGLDNMLIFTSRIVAYSLIFHILTLGDLMGDFLMAKVAVFAVFAGIVEVILAREDLCGVVEVLAMRIMAFGMKEKLADAVLGGWERDWGLLVGLVVDNFDDVVEILLVGFGDLHFGREGVFGRGR